MANIYQRISSLLPKKLVKAFRREMDYLDINISEKRFVGFLLLYGTLLSIGLAINAFLFLNIHPVPVFFFFFVLFFGGAYLWLNLTAESEGRFVEGILPDALQLIASNVKSGLTTERALIAAARNEFGPLALELKRASTEIMSGTRIDAALMGITKRIKSVTLERTIWLISKGISSGGQIGDLLVQLSDDLREQNIIKREVAANISMYILLIFFTAAFGGPILFGVSSFIVQILATQMTSMPALAPEVAAQVAGRIGSAGALIGGGERTVVSTDFILFFIMITLVATSLFASMTIGIINTGKEKGGLKFVPIILFVGFSLFFIVRMVLTSFFGELLL